jgi:hypothetical protein
MKSTVHKTSSSQHFFHKVFQIVEKMFVGQAAIEQLVGHSTGDHVIQCSNPASDWYWEKTARTKRCFETVVFRLLKKKMEIKIEF